MVETWALVGAGVGLASFGVGYNALTTWLERRGWHEGNAALLVVGGTLVTLIALGMLDLAMPGWNAGMLGLYCFSCSGAPMVIGSAFRHAQMRQAEREQERQLVALGGEDANA